MIIPGVALAIMIISMPLYAYHTLKLTWYLEKNHKDELEKMNFPKKLSKFCYFSTPRTGGNFIKFVYSKNNFNDSTITSLKPKIKFAILLFFLGIFGVIYIFWKEVAGL